MGEPTVPEDVYSEAAIAYTATAGWEPRIRKAASDPYAQERQFRAAVESAYQAGYERCRRDRQAALDQIAAHPAVMRQIADLAATSAVSMREATEAVAGMTAALMREGTDARP